MNKIQLTVALLASAQVAEALIRHPDPELAGRLADILKAAAGSQVEALNPEEQNRVQEWLIRLRTPSADDLERLFRL